MYKKQKTVCFTSVQKKVTILFLVHSIAWTSEQNDGGAESVKSTECSSDLGLLNLILAVGSLYDVRISNSADVAVMLSH